MKRQVKAHLPTDYGNFDMIVYADTDQESKPDFALVHRDIDLSKPVAVRIHSECLTGDLLGSSRCDCGEQLSKSLQIIESRQGVLIYLRQEGRGIGLINKLKAYNLQDSGLNTIDANIHLGFEADKREYELAIEILIELGIKSIDLITNNPEKIEAIEMSPVKLHSRIPIIISPTDKNKAYLSVKKDLMGHLLSQ